MIGDFLQGRKRDRMAISMLMLYAGKTSGIVINLIFVPIYSLKLGSEAFGLVAIILSLQALLLMLDLGMSTLIGRDIAANEYSPGELLRQVFSAELGLAFLYGALMLVVTMLTLAGVRFGTEDFIAPALVVLFALLVLQNLYYSAIIARRAYTSASALQLVGNLVRAGGTAVVLTYFSPTLGAFVASQLIGALLQFVVARRLCIREFKSDPLHQEPLTHASIWQCTLALLRRAKPVALLSAAGAAVTQLDKPIISLFMTPTSVAPYFLAMTYCMVPMALLAGPVAQFFQPMVINAVSAGDVKRSSYVVRMFTATLLAITLLPSAAMYLFDDLLVGKWLHQGPLVKSTLDYIQVLLPGLTIGALGYLPYSLLLVSRDYKFMAMLSTVMTAVTLLVAALAASEQSVRLVCATYATYHAASTMLQWIRAFNMPQIREHARSSAKMTLLILFFTVAILVLLQRQVEF
jgi:O-antigen/teichoic acid export membrane protein